MLEVALVVPDQLVWIGLVLLGVLLGLAKLYSVPVFKCVLLAKRGVNYGDHSCWFCRGHFALKFSITFVALWSLNCGLTQIHILHLSQTVFKLLNSKLYHFLDLFCLMFKCNSLRIFQNFLYRLKNFCILFILWSWNLFWFSFAIEFFSI